MTSDDTTPTQTANHSSTDGSSTDSSSTDNATSRRRASTQPFGSGEHRPPSPRHRPLMPCVPGTVLTTGAEVFDHLVGLAGPYLPFSRAAWFTFLDGDGRVVPVAVPFERLPSRPSAAAVSEIVEVISTVVSQTPGGLEVLAALCRPSGGDLGTFERRWAAALWRAADTAGWSLRAVVAVGRHRARPLDRDRCL